jgi:hypothetical protein
MHIAVYTVVRFDLRHSSPEISMPTDRDIRQLCTHVSLAQDDEEFRVRLAELRFALQEQMSRPLDFRVYLMKASEPMVQPHRDGTINLVLSSRKARP